MKHNKDVISELAKIENWSEFEEFVKRLYEGNSGAICVERNYIQKGQSGRKREVDVLVKFGFNPHIISLGIECKYWSNKIDGDIIDIAAAKRDDLRLDKYAVISTMGYEAGAELYAKSKGIDLFIIRPSSDNDFGYTGKVVKFVLEMCGSSPTGINFNAQVIAEQGKESFAAQYVKSKISDIKFCDDDSGIDPQLDLHHYNSIPTLGGGVIYTQGERVENLVKIIYNAWADQNSKFWGGTPASRTHRILFKKPTAIFLPHRIIATIKEINFRIEYIKCISEFEIDRGLQHPLVLENVIERAITPIKSSQHDEVANFSMCESTPIQDIDYSKTPEDVLGRDGARITLVMRKPLGIDEADPNVKFYSFRESEEGNKWHLVSRP